MLKNFKRLLILCSLTIFIQNFYPVIDGSLRDCLRSQSEEELQKYLPIFEVFTRNNNLGKIPFVDIDGFDNSNDDLFYRFQDFCPEDAQDKAAWAFVYYFIFYSSLIYSRDEPDFVERKYRDVRQAFDFCPQPRKNAIFDLCRDLYKAAIVLDQPGRIKPKIGLISIGSIAVFKAQILRKYRPVGFYSLEFAGPFEGIVASNSYIRKFIGLYKFLHPFLADPDEPLPTIPQEELLPLPERKGWGCVIS